MGVNFGICIFRERPADCKHGVERTRECTARDSEILQCYLDHYGNTLLKDAGIRLIDSLTHIIIANDEVEDI